MCDLSLYLVEKFCGRQTAVQSAKTMILDLGREVQTPYKSYFFPGDQGDPLVEKTRNWIEQHCAQTIDYDELAGKFRISRRSLERRFKRAAGLTPLGYQQQVRVEMAKRLLEADARSFNEITCMVGYEDVPFFRKVFRKLTGLRPGEYRRRFGGYSAKPRLAEGGDR